MEKIIFEDLPSTNTPINSTNLNKMQDNFEIALKRNIMTLCLSDDYTATNSDWGVVQLQLYNSTGNKLSFSNGGIKIGSGVSKIKVSTDFYLMGVSSGSRYFNIWKNNSQTKLNAGVIFLNANTDGKVACCETMVNVNENDIILSACSLQNQDRLGAGATFLTVEVIEEE